MPRKQRSLQVEFDPGTSGTVDGAFKDKDDKDQAVTVEVAVWSCEAPGGGDASVAKSAGRWTVELPPDAVQDLEGLVDEDDVPVRLTIVSRPCHEPGTPGQDQPEVPEPWKHPDIDAEAAPDIAAPDDARG